MYLRTDEEAEAAEAAEALSMATLLAETLDRNVGTWRWVIIALHNAVQGFMVLSLRHGNGLLALSDESFSAWMEAHEKGGPYPKEERLDSYLGLYKKIKSKDIGKMGGNARFSPKGTEGKSIKKLNELRNEFIHFTPKGWILEIDGLPRVCMDCLRVVEFLGLETSNIFWHERSHKEKSQLCCKKLRDQMAHLDRVYAEFRS